MHLFHSFCLAISTYSRIPVPQVTWSEENQRCAMGFFPVIGIVIGTVLWLWLWLCQRFGFGPWLQGTVAAAIPLIVTGGIHMDGFMDTTDAMASWKSMEERRAILKDSHVGAFAVIGCVLYLLCMTGLFSEAVPQDAISMIACFVLSRSCSALTMMWFRQANRSGMLATMSERQNKRAVTLACGLWWLLAVSLLLVFSGWAGTAALAGCVLSTAAYRHKAYVYFDGVSGDLAGWYLQVTELVCLGCVILGRCVPS